MSKAAAQWRQVSPTGRVHDRIERSTYPTGRDPRAERLRILRGRV